MGKQRKLSDRKSLLGKKPINKAKRPTAKHGPTPPTTTTAKTAIGNFDSRTIMTNPGHIKNRLKRSEVYGKYLQEKKRKKRELRLQREKQVEALGEEDDNDAGTTMKQTPKTLDNTREIEPTSVNIEGDTEIMMDEAEDEFAPYFSAEAAADVIGKEEASKEENDNDDTTSNGDGILRPKVLITTRPKPSAQLFYFIADLQKLIPNLHFYPRKSFTMKQIVAFGQNRDYTHLLVLSEKSKQVNGLILSHLLRTNSRPNGGPTAFFKVSNVVVGKDIPGHGNAVTTHTPELVLNGLTTRLGHRVGRLLASLFPNLDARFRGRQVVTFHNQRDYIFVRQHRYVFQEKNANELKLVHKNKPQQPQKPATSSSGETTKTTKKKKDDDVAFEDKMKTKLQELGPRFTLKMRWLQEGTFDTQFGEYEWYHKRKEMDTSRRKFHL